MAKLACIATEAYRLNAHALPGWDWMCGGPRYDAPDGTRYVIPGNGSDALPHEEIDVLAALCPEADVRDVTNGVPEGWNPVEPVAPDAET